MPVPQHLRGLLYASGSWRLPGEDDTECEGAHFHSPRPMFVHDVRLVPYEWLTEHGINPGVVTLRAWLCGTCQDNISILQQVLKANGGSVPWEVRREFGNTIRRLAVQGWLAYHQALSAHG